MKRRAIIRRASAFPPVAVRLSPGTAFAAMRQPSSIPRWLRAALIVSRVTVSWCTAGDKTMEEFMLKGNNIFLKVLLGIVLILLIAILVRVFFLAPAAAVKLAAIPDTEYDPAVWGGHYPLEYQSYLKNGEMAPSPTGFGGSVKEQKSVKEPEILTNFKG